MLMTSILLLCLLGDSICYCGVKIIFELIIDSEFLFIVFLFNFDRVFQFFGFNQLCQASWFGKVFAKFAFIGDLTIFALGVFNVEIQF